MMIKDIARLDMIAIITALNGWATKISGTFSVSYFKMKLTLLLIWLFLTENFVEFLMDVVLTALGGMMFRIGRGDAATKLRLVPC